MNAELTAAFEFAERVHAGQKREGTDTPSIYHPLAVASLVLQYGGSFDQARAALLHDTISAPGVSEEILTEKFGRETARLAYAFADGAMGPAFVERLKTLDEDALLIIACEELHEGRELLHDLRYRGVQVWKRHSVHAMDVTWYFRELLRVFHSRLKEQEYMPLVAEFGAMVRSLQGVTFEGERA